MNKKKNRFRRVRGILLIAFGCCCILAAAALGVLNEAEDERAGEASALLTTNIQTLLTENTAPELENAEDGELTRVAIEAAIETVAEEVPDKTVSVDGYDVCGIITMPDINISLAVISEWSYPNLTVTACRYSGAPDEQMILVAHNYRRHFGKIKNLDPGDEVSFTDAEGTVYHYEVTGTEQWPGGQMEEIVAGDWDLTMFTCTYGGENRIVVRCARI